MSNSTKLAKTQDKKSAHPTHLTPAQRKAKVLKVQAYSGTGYTDREGTDKRQRISKAGI